MMTYQTQAIAEYRIQEARQKAATRREARIARIALQVDHGGNHGGIGVIDAVGHGLIAIGSRLVSESRHDPHPTDRRAA